MEAVFKQPMFIIGVSLLAVGISTANPGFWIPGSVFMVIGWSKKSKG